MNLLKSLDSFFNLVLNLFLFFLFQIFHYILRRVGFPYQNCNPISNRFDALLLYQLKEENCHLNIDICGLAEKTFHVALPGQFSCNSVVPNLIQKSSIMDIKWKFYPMCRLKKYISKWTPSSESVFEINGWETFVFIT